MLKLKKPLHFPSSPFAQSPVPFCFFPPTNPPKYQNTKISSFFFFLLSSPLVTHLHLHLHLQLPLQDSNPVFPSLHFLSLSLSFTLFLC
ncbi:hypothetical protein RIF29_14141 [Crotalaria pallida]|uniref:Uncharacterized protein n=1 Tax=Crotalaria pallida TaxID=3830 RepID=A0AAN9FCV8_CROPI